MLETIAFDSSQRAPLAFPPHPPLHTEDKNNGSFKVVKTTNNSKATVPCYNGACICQELTLYWGLE